jgi:hypothetical protein
MSAVIKRWTFISYSRKDKEFALELARALKSAGHFVWLDQLDIPTGARWDDEVEKALRECDIFLIVMTAASISSENVKDEIGYAIDHRKRIIPVLLEECDVPLRLRRFQYVDFTKLKFDEGVKRAKQLLESSLNSAPIPVPPKTLPEVKERSTAEIATASPSSPAQKSAPRRSRLGATGIVAFAVLICALPATYIGYLGVRGILTSIEATQNAEASQATFSSNSNVTQATNAPSETLVFTPSPSIATSGQTNSGTNPLGIPLQGCIVTARFGARLQAEPDMSSMTMVDLTEDRQYEASHRSDAFPTWFYILYEGQGGWVSSQFLLVSPSCGNSPTGNDVPSTSLQGCLVTTRFGARLQAEPDMGSLTMVDLPEDRQYGASHRSDEFPTWFYVLHEGQGGWVSSQFLIVSSGCAE